VQFELQEEPPLGNWSSAGGWFTSFVGLGIYLGRFTDSNSSKISRILLSVPRKEFVSTAIALGLSIHKFKSKASILKEIRESDLLELPQASKLRLVLKYGHLDVMFHKYFPDGKYLRCTVGGLHKSRNQLTSHIQRIYLLPGSHPEGDYSMSREEYENLEKNDERYIWRTQSAPSAAIFGEVDNFKLQASAHMKNDFISKMFGMETIALEEAARIDSVSGHSKSSLINGYGGTSEFLKFPIAEGSIVDLFEWIILDGNNAINRLSATENLLDKSVISILELGVPRSQGKAIDTFTSELNRYNSIDVTSLLGWKPPVGVNVWGWAK
jgi:hypothetical protein